MTPPGIYLGLVMSETAYDHTTGVYRASLKTGYTSDHLGAVAGLPKSVVRHELRHRTVAVRPSNTSAGSGRCHHRELDAAQSPLEDVPRLGHSTDLEGTTRCGPRVNDVPAS